MNDEQQIRDVIQTWMNATEDGDVETVLDIMTEDVVFLVAGQEPFGKEAFRQAAETMNESDNVNYEAESNIEEINVHGDWAYARTQLNVTTIPADRSTPTHRSGYTLSIFRKGSDGCWRLSRDANLLTET